MYVYFTWWTTEAGDWWSAAHHRLSQSVCTDWLFWLQLLLLFSHQPFISCVDREKETLKHWKTNTHPQLTWCLRFCSLPRSNDDQNKTSILANSTKNCIVISEEIWNSLNNICIYTKPKYNIGEKFWRIIFMNKIRVNLTLWRAKWHLLGSWPLTWTTDSVFCGT